MARVRGRAKSPTAAPAPAGRGPGRGGSAGRRADGGPREEGWARRYGLGPGDTWARRLGEGARSFTVTSVRKADWDSFQVNFFLLLNAGAVGDAPYSLISSFHLAPGQTARLAPLVREFPNVSVLEIEAILQRVRIMRADLAAWE